jgi:L-erythro-3,5-diaminohexanoate dehydrogenase
MATSPIGLHRVVSPAGVLPQAADQLDNSPEIGRDEVRISVERLNLDAASFRQLSSAYDADGVRQAVLDIVAARGKMQNPVTGSGGMLIGTVAEVGPDSPLGLRVGDRVATLVSLTLTPLAITDGLSRWDGRSEQVPCEGHAILFARSIAAVLPPDMDASLALAVLDVCGAPALTARVVAGYAAANASAAALAPSPAAFDVACGGEAATPSSVATNAAADAVWPAGEAGCEGGLAPAGLLTRSSTSVGWW